MKKSKHINNAFKRSTKSNNTPVKNDSTTSKVDSIDDDEQGFGGWLRSTEGMENMKLFVIANSIVLLTTLAYPHLQIVIELITDALYGYDGFAFRLLFSMGILLWYSMNLWHMITEYFNKEFQKTVLSEADEFDYEDV